MAYLTLSFSCTPSGATASAVICSLVETAKVNNLKPRKYLEYVLTQMSQITTGQIDQSLAWSPSIPEPCRMPAKASPAKTKD
jgi:hypothetical protein